MAALPTIDETVDIGDISTYLSGNDNAKGNLFGPKLAAPKSPVLIAMVTDALRWGNDGGAQTDASLRAVANYLIWLCGRYALQARNILGITSGGGAVTPGGGGSSANAFPLYIRSADFTNATQYTNPVMAGQNLIVFMNEINRYLIPEVETTHVGNVITINIPGFDAEANEYNLVIERYTN